MFAWLMNPEAWIALGTLTALEIVLGIDNIIFLSILVGRLPEHQRAMALLRQQGGRACARRTCANNQDVGGILLFHACSSAGGRISTISASARCCASSKVLRRP